jgi:hypothetical protein
MSTETPPRRLRPTVSGVIAVIALFVALGGSSYAALKLPRNSVGSGQVRDGSLLPKDLAAATLTSGPRGARGPRGADGPAGATEPLGATGPAGPRGPSNAYVTTGASGSLPAQANVLKTVASLEDLPAGNYVLSFSAQPGDFTNGGEIVSCDIRVDGRAVAGASAVVGAGAGSARVAVISSSTGVTRTSPFRVTLDCATDQALATPPGLANPRITAIRVESLQGAS